MELFPPQGELNFCIGSEGNDSSGYREKEFGKG